MWLVVSFETHNKMVQLVLIFDKGDARVKNVGNFESISSLPLTQDIIFKKNPVGLLTCLLLYISYFG
jgi:hypothetical protein